MKTGDIPVPEVNHTAIRISSVNMSQHPNSEHFESEAARLIWHLHKRTPQKKRGTSFEPVPRKKSQQASLSFDISFKCQVSK
ncbi:Uncharacterized protein dnm_060990 [Desulfonema magnum]|uniref:Uncharacterized protein n=1 Tax=Desulfonema magnum TaxID=45655 RepID=A0A975BRT8_9BACT|nr:Uncharacterized protein dnm_060990 [Desulfonema magnum]